jgi:hypothetical protein
MQTFLPYPHFAESAKVLDYRRLGKQRVEVLQLLKALQGGGGWSNHPAAKMWRGYEDALVYYGTVMCREWLNRGYKDTCLDKIQSFATKSVITEPPWLGDSDFHAAHRSNLLRKDPVHYGQFGWTEPNDLPYIWPIS